MPSHDAVKFALKSDHRDAIGGWCDGDYICLCVICGSWFLGDKRAYECADCAHKVEPSNQVGEGE